MPVVVDNRLVSPISFGGGSLYLTPTSADPEVDAATAEAAFDAMNPYKSQTQEMKPLVFLASLTSSQDTVDRPTWIVFYADVQDEASGGVAPKPVNQDILGIVDAASGKLKGLISAASDKIPTRLDANPITTGKP